MGWNIRWVAATAALLAGSGCIGFGSDVGIDIGFDTGFGALPGGPMNPHDCSQGLAWWEPDGGWLDVALGERHTCGVLDSGELSCWGGGTFGEDLPPAGATWVAVESGGYFSCALDELGQIACWGDDTYGQLEAPEGVFEHLVAGQEHVCALDAAGQATCWGAGAVDEGFWPHFGQASPPTESFVELVAGTLYTCGVRADDSLLCWGATEGATGPGSEYLDGEAPPATLNGFVAADGAATYACAAFEGDLWCWGEDPLAIEGGYSGILDPPWTDDVVEVSAGARQACLRTSEGEVRCWGVDEECSLEPAPGDFQQIDVGGQSACALNGLGAMRCWGPEYFGG